MLQPSFRFLFIVVFFCLSFVYYVLIIFSAGFKHFSVFSPIRLKETHPDSTEDSIPDSNLHFPDFFPMFSRFPKFFLQNQHFAAKLLFWFLFVYLLLLLFFSCVFCWVSVFQLFLFRLSLFFLICFLFSVVFRIVFLKYFLFFLICSLILEFCEELFFSQNKPAINSWWFGGWKPWRFTTWKHQLCLRRRAIKRDAPAARFQ